MAVTDWNTNANSNTSVGGINIAENCPAGNINGALREMMAQIKGFSNGLGNDYQAKNANLTSLAGLSVAANKLPYGNGTNTLALTDLTPFMRTLLDDPDAATAMLTLGGVRVSALSLANPGYIRFQVGASSFLQLAWGTFTGAPNATTSVNYAASFPNASFPVCSGGYVDAGADANWPSVTGASASGFTAYCAYNVAIPSWYIAIGY